MGVRLFPDLRDVSNEYSLKCLQLIYSLHKIKYTKRHCKCFLYLEKQVKQFTIVIRFRECSCYSLNYGLEFKFRTYSILSNVFYKLFFELFLPAPSARRKSLFFCRVWLTDRNRTSMVIDIIWLQKNSQAVTFTTEKKLLPV